MNNDIINSNITQGISYEGEVTISLVNANNKVLAKTTLNNSGRLPLFRFFTSCLGNEWSAAQKQCPCRIVLFKKEDNESAHMSDENYWTTYWTSNNALTPDNGILYAIPPVQSLDTTNNTSSVKYHFRVPTALLSSPGSSIAKLGLYPNLVITSDPAAYVFLKSADTELLQTASNNQNLLILIDWELIISNKVKTSSTQ